MKKLFLYIAVFVMAICANAQTNQYFWYQGNLMMGNPIAQIDSVTFGNEDTDSILIYLPRTIIKEVHDTVYITIHDTVCPNDIPEGALTGIFSVSDTKKVRFSKGNAQYQASTDKWRFAENQYDITGHTSYFSDTEYSGWIDLFGWGTGNNPMNNDNNPSHYSTFVDWGINFPVNNNPTWRTLSDTEWTYLIQQRENHEYLLIKAQVLGINGIVIFPDNFINNHNNQIQYGNTIPYISNSFDGQLWSTLESEGAVFLPAAGWADNDYYQSPNVYSINEIGNYWSSTPYDEYSIYEFWFDSSNVYVHYYSGSEASDKRSVRLVQDVE